MYPDPDTTNSTFKLPKHIMPPKDMPDVAWSISGFVKGHPDIVQAYNTTYGRYCLRLLLAGCALHCIIAAAAAACVSARAPKSIF